MTINASMVKELRERTGAGMMECKKTLVETSGDLEAAIDLMRTRGQAKAAKRASKIAAEGRITVAVTSDQRRAVMVETNCETDFVARDTGFVAFSDQVTQTALSRNVTDVSALMQQSVDDNSGASIEKVREELVAKIGENIQVRRVAELADSAFVGHYLHGERIGVLVALDKPNAGLARDIAMHIAAMKPMALHPEDVSADVLEREKQIFIEQARQSGKPDNIIEKMIDGRVRKFLEEVCLLGQAFVKNPDQSIAQLLKEHATKVTAFVRFEVGEGIEKEVVDFAEEVKSQVQAAK